MGNGALMGKFTIIEEGTGGAAPAGKSRGTFTIIESPGATKEQQQLASAPSRFLKGLKDPIDAGAQLLQRALPQGVIDAVNQFAPSLGMTPMTQQQLDADISGSNAQMESARAATGQEGFDAARLAGNVLSPVNAGLAAALPVVQGG